MAMQSARDSKHRREARGVGGQGPASQWQRGMATRADARPGGGPDKSKWKADSKIDNAAAVQKMRTKAEEGDVTAQFTLGAALMRGQLGLPKNAKEASEWLTKAADSGNHHAQLNLAMLYNEGDGVAKDEKKAAEYFHLAADAGLAAAQFYLGGCYEKGAGVEQDLSEAAILYARAVAQQHEPSSLKLALCYLAGRGVEQDYPRAVNLLAKPANNGVSEAQFVLGYLYLNGEGGVKQDLPHALSMLELAGNSGFLKAKWYLAVCYLNGHQVSKDEQKATALFQEAALKGHADSCFELFKVFSKGSGLEKESKLWLQRAALAGHVEAKKLAALPN